MDRPPQPTTQCKPPPRKQARYRLRRLTTLQVNSRACALVATSTRSTTCCSCCCCCCCCCCCWSFPAVGSLDSASGTALAAAAPAAGTAVSPAPSTAGPAGFGKTSAPGASAAGAAAGASAAACGSDGARAVAGAAATPCISLGSFAAFIPGHPTASCESIELSHASQFAAFGSAGGWPSQAEQRHCCRHRRRR